MSIFLPGYGLPALSEAFLWDCNKITWQASDGGNIGCPCGGCFGGGGYRLVSSRGHAGAVRQADSYAVGLQQLPQRDWERAVASLSAALEQAADGEKDEIFRFIESGEMSRCQQGMTQKTLTWLSLMK